MISGSTPPSSGPTTAPAMMPDERTPSAQPLRSLGAWAATRMVAAELYPPKETDEQPECD